MRGTGVFATPEERESFVQMAQQAKATPFHILPGGGNPAAAARHKIKEVINKAALAHGLPPIWGLYDILDTGEFLRPSGPEGEAQEAKNGEAERDPDGEGPDNA